MSLLSFSPNQSERNFKVIKTKTNLQQERTPSKVSASVISDTASAVLPTDGESAIIAPSLFEDDIPGMPQVDAHDFFNTVGVAQDDGESHPVHVPHTTMVWILSCSHHRVGSIVCHFRLYKNQWI
jgi:hypothetical protein